MLSVICFNLDQSKILSSGNGLKELQESMDRCTGYCDITETSLNTIPKGCPGQDIAEIMFKMTLNTLLSIKQSLLFCETVIIPESIFCYEPGVTRK